MGHILPKLALSVRQPWAHAIVHLGKDIENRSWRRGNPGLSFRGPVCLHAGKGMTRDEYEDAAATFRMIGVAVPAPDQLLRGGIVGTAEIVDIVTESESPWFFGPKGLVLANIRPVEFIPCAGALGFFEWRRNVEGQPEPAARWMQPAAEPTRPKRENDLQGSLF